MSMSESEYAEQEYLEKLYEEFGPQWAEEHGLAPPEDAIEEFTAERLQSYYIAHPNLAGPACDSLVYARSLMPSHPKAALVFAVTATELAIKTVLLKPIIFGLVHTEALASFITDLTTKHTGMDRFQTILTEILARFGGVDLKTYKRTASSKTLWGEIGEVQQARNAVVHQGGTAEDSKADLSIAVATTLLSEIFPHVLANLNLHMHDPGIVCSKSHTTRMRVMLAMSEGLRAYSFIWNVEIHSEVSAEDVPNTITGRLAGRPNERDLSAVRSGNVVMKMIEEPFLSLRYQVQFSPDSLEFTGTRMCD